MSTYQKQIHYEFGGPVGALGVIIGLPIVIYALYFLCNDQQCMTWSTTTTSTLTTTLTSTWSWPHHVSELISWEAVYMYLGWMLFHVGLERILPGETVEGTVLPNKQRLSYVMSGHLQFWLTLVALGHVLPKFKIIRQPGQTWWEAVYAFEGFQALPITWIYDHYLGLITMSILFTFVFSLYLYITSFLPRNKILAKGGNTGNAIYDFFIGRELNPRIGSLDLKEFCELRPGLIGWAVINLGMAAKQYSLHGSVSLSMLLITALQGFYVWDALYMEKAILTTMDITTDGFGYMLCFGDLAWVPFIYSLQARYLVDHDPHLPVYQILIIFGIYLLGYYIFRSANSEKDAFRRDPTSPEVAHLQYLPTKRGTKLLTSGWWGAARKINYTGDWLITLSWCLLCGFDSPIPYFQAVYFLILLIHRAIRDDELCHEKYGDDWLEYKKQVPYLFIPFVI